MSLSERDLTPVRIEALLSDLRHLGTPTAERAANVIRALQAQRVELTADLERTIRARHARRGLDKPPR